MEKFHGRTLEEKRGFAKDLKQRAGPRRSIGPIRGKSRIKGALAKKWWFERALVTYRKLSEMFCGEADRGRRFVKVKLIRIAKPPSNGGW